MSHTKKEVESSDKHYDAYTDKLNADSMQFRDELNATALSAKGSVIVTEYDKNLDKVLKNRS